MTLNERTEGWIVGLLLAAMSLKRQPSYETFIEQFAGSHQFILDYLAEEVLQGLPDAHRQFLLQTSILGRFCAALCCAVTGNAASSQVLDEIRKGNLFLIPLDPGGCWFRYHHLFAEVLSTLLERDHAGEISAIHLKAAAWFDDQGHADEAVDHALRSGDMAQAKALILKHWAPIIHEGQVSTVLHWLDALPEELKRGDPAVSLARCWALFVSGQSLAIEAPLEEANVAYERLVSEGTLSGTLQSLVAAQLAMMRSVLARGRGKHADSVAHAGQAVRLAPLEEPNIGGSAWNISAAARAGAGDLDGAIEAYGRGIELQYGGGNLVGAYMCTYRRVMYVILQGRLSEAGAVCRSAMERAVREGHGALPATGWLHLAMAEIELERFRLDKTEAYLNDGLRIARSGGLGEVQRLGRYLRAHLAAARGDRDGAVDALHGAERIVSAMDDPYLSGELAMEWAALCLNAGELGAARKKLALMEGKTTVTQHAILHLARDWMPLRLLSAEGRYDEALTELDEVIPRTRASKSWGELVRGKIDPFDDTKCPGR